MWFIQCDVTIESDRTLAEVAESLANALNIPRMEIDRSGRYEEVTVYVSTCFGLEFSIGRTIEDPPNTYQLSIVSNVDWFDFDGLEKDVDATKYALAMLKKGNIKCSPRDPSLLYELSE